MAKIKVGELRDIQKEFVKDIDIVNIHGVEIEVVQYLPIDKKIELATAIYKSCVNTDDGLLITSETSRDIATVYLLTQYYTNLTLPQDVLEGYNLLISTGIYEIIKENIIDEVNRVEELVDNIKMEELIKYEQENTIMYVIKNMLNELISKVPTADEAKKLIEEASKEIENFDPEKMKFVKDFLTINSGGKIDGDKNL